MKADWGLCCVAGFFDGGRQVVGIFAYGRWWVFFSFFQRERVVGVTSFVAFSTVREVCQVLLGVREWLFFSFCVLHMFMSLCVWENTRVSVFFFFLKRRFFIVFFLYGRESNFVWLFFLLTNSFSFFLWDFFNIYGYDNFFF